jgi:hypothetical protein
MSCKRSQKPPGLKLVSEQADRGEGRVESTRRVIAQVQARRVHLQDRPGQQLKLTGTFLFARVCWIFRVFLKDAGCFYS